MALGGVGGTANANNNNDSGSDGTTTATNADTAAAAAASAAAAFVLASPPRGARAGSTIAPSPTTAAFDLGSFDVHDR